MKADLLFLLGNSLVFQLKLFSLSLQLHLFDLLTFLLLSDNLFMAHAILLLLKLSFLSDLLLFDALYFLFSNSLHFCLPLRVSASQLLQEG